MFEFITKYRFLDPSQVLAHAGIPRGAKIADLGCGNGYYPVALAELAGSDGEVYAVDVQEEALEATVSLARHRGLKNIYTIRHNLEKPGLKIPENSCDFVVLASTLHQTKNQKNVLRESYRLLKTGGKLLVIEWKKVGLPFGPEISRRLSEQQTEELLTQNHFRYVSELPIDRFHYALIYIK
jgi:ubiquinone/menaquinone biosynthesis C-methylase UbiE